MKNEPNSLCPKPKCPPFCIDVNDVPGICRLRNHHKNIISVVYNDRYVYITVMTDNGIITLIYKMVMDKAVERLRKDVFYCFHENYVFNKNYVDTFECNDEGGYTVHMFYGPDMRVSKKNRLNFKTKCPGIKMVRKRRCG
jgi:hypothetical protein